MPLPRRASPETTGETTGVLPSAHGNLCGGKASTSASATTPASGAEDFFESNGHHGFDAARRCCGPRGRLSSDANGLPRLARQLSSGDEGEAIANLGEDGRPPRQSDCGTASAAEQMRRTLGRRSVLHL